MVVFTIEVFEKMVSFMKINIMVKYCLLYSLHSLPYLFLNLVCVHTVILTMEKKCSFWLSSQSSYNILLERLEFIENFDKGALIFSFVLSITGSDVCTHKISEMWYTRQWTDLNKKTIFHSSRANKILSGANKILSGHVVLVVHLLITTLLTSEFISSNRTPAKVCLMTILIDKDGLFSCRRLVVLFRYSSFLYQTGTRIQSRLLNVPLNTNKQINLQ